MEMGKIVRLKNISFKELQRLRDIFQVFEQWKLSREEQCALLGTHEFLLYVIQKRKCKALDVEIYLRISYLLDIDKALNILLPRKQSADSWVKRKQQSGLFKGKSALGVMLSGNLEDMKLVHRYLQAKAVGN